MTLKKYLLYWLILTPFIACSQNSDLGNWLIYFGNHQLNQHWNWHHEIQYRNYNAIGDLEQLLIRTGIGRNLTENNNNLLLGYGYILSENYLGQGQESKATVVEHRVYQQFITRQTIGRLSVQHRYRFEQRFVASDFRLRFRYFLSLNLPLYLRGMAENSLYLSAYNELFIDTSEVPFDRNRLYGGVGYRFSKHVKIELGYMNQFFGRDSRDQINVISFINF